ncbi:MAG: flagellar hook capping FlgD N-terminal domain-containing protein [Aquabacterium sp.]|nr:flagellar hook capping FlgD N-terminal domain-containing protein [Aquabacterium sp.]
MTTTSGTSATSAANPVAAAANKKNSNSTTEASDRFLKLLVTQMKNQDPLNPMDNAQVTSQMAQINTVTGIDKLNTTITTMSNNMSQMQMMQGAVLVGHAVMIEGNKLAVDASTGKASGGYELAANAASVNIDILDAAGNKVGNVTAAGKGAGRQDFEWTAPKGTSTSGLTFKVTATSKGKSSEATPLMTDMVDAVSTANGSLTLELRNSGSTAYSKVLAVS